MAENASTSQYLMGILKEQQLALPPCINHVTTGRFRNQGIGELHCGQKERGDTID